MKKAVKTTEKSATDFDFKSIKSFEDACKKENIDPTVLPDVSQIPIEFAAPTIAVYKLFIIYKAINNGWVPDWNDWNQYKYFPWYKVLASGSGFDFSCSYYHYTGTNATVGSRLCTDTSEKALYIAKQFGEEYKEYFLIQA